MTRLRPLLLPTEHGGWGFLVEPLLVAWLAAPSVAGGWLAVAALGAFLARQPLKVVLDDRRHGRLVARTPVARAIAAVFLAAALGALAAAGATAHPAFWPLAAAVGPMALVTLWYDSRGESRRLIPELSGATALAALAAASALAAGWSWPLALAVWVSVLLRVLPAIVTIRERIRRLHGEAPAWREPVAAHAVALTTAAGMTLVHALPPGIPAIVALLGARAAWDLRPGAPPSPAMRIGVRELVTGLAAAGAIGIAWQRH